MPENAEKKLIHFLTMLKHEIEMRDASGTREHRQVINDIADAKARLEALNADDSEALS